MANERAPAPPVVHKNQEKDGRPATPLLTSAPGLSRRHKRRDLVEDGRESGACGEVVRELEIRRLVESIERLHKRQRRVRRYSLDGEK